jgi:hypothetical protein
MTKGEFAALKPTLGVLRRSSDPPPRARMTPGVLPHDDVFGAVGAFLEKEIEHCGQSRHRMIRGYKLFTMAQTNSKEGACFVARPHAVVESTQSGKYTCLVQNPHSLPNEYIFVPSSLMHEELTDDQLFSGAFLLCDVVGGDAASISYILPLSKCLSRFERRRLTTRPGQMPAPSAVYVRYMPWFIDWFQSTNRTIPSALLTDVSVSFGMPYRPLEAHECRSPEALACKSQSGMFFTNPEEVSASEFLNPIQPFAFEKDTWLPSVSSLRSFFGLCTEAYSNTRLEDQKELFYKLYDSLQTEYFKRMEYIARRSSANDQSHVFGIWK